MNRLVFLLATVATLGCGDTTATAPSQLNLDRPVDMTFGCFGGLRVTDGRPVPTIDDPVVFSAQPTAACDIRSGDHETGTPTPTPENQKDLTSDGGSPIPNANWFAFILQSGPGTVAMAFFATKPATAFAGADVSVLDADPLTPGKNSISVGEDPIALVTDAAGCKVVTANAGSCDLSVLDIGSAVDNNPDTPIDVQRIDVKNAAGAPLRAKPAAMAVEPGIDVIGKVCPISNPDAGISGASGLVYIAYPSCHLVATVDLSTGTVVGGIRYGAAGPEIIPVGEVANVTCPDECSGGGVITAGTRPVTLDLERTLTNTDPPVEERRLVIGSDNSSSITLVELANLTTLPDSLSQIALEDNSGNGTLGVTQLVLSPQIGMGGQNAVINDSTAAGGQFQFVYAITTDHTIRVADILGLGKECDTQVDPRFTREIRSVKTLSCMPVGDPLTPPRRAGVRGPGIQLLGVGEEAIPISVDIIKSKEVEGDDRPGLGDSPDRLIGYFAIITASNGGTFIVNVDDDDYRDLFDVDRPIFVPMPIAVAHQVRDSIPLRGELAKMEVEGGPAVDLCDVAGPVDGAGGAVGGPRSLTPPQRAVPTGAYAPEKITQLPGLRQLLCVGADSTRVVSELQFTAPEAVRDEVFPDVQSLVREETWTLTWEGSLSNDIFETDVDGPKVRESQIFVDSAGMRIVDQTRPFCDTGIEKFDIIQLRGCDPAIGNADCPIGYRCFLHPASQVQGIGACMLENEADRLAEACKDFLTSVRRYTVGTTESGELQLLPRRHTLRTTPVEGCTSDAQCELLADYAVTNSSTQHPRDDMSEPDPRTWKCEADPNRTPVTTGKRCAMKCDSTSDCVTGTVCSGAGAAGAFAGTCMEGVTPPQACVNAPQRYEPRAGEAFAVLGQSTGFEHSIIADTNGKCIQNPAANRLIAGRIPLVPPACDPTANPLTGQKPDLTFEPNPCSLTTKTTDIVPLYEPGTCSLATIPTEFRERDAPAIKFRNRGLNLTITDPYYPGDLDCILDRAGTLGNIPHVFTNYQLGFRQTAGYAPLLLPINPSFPRKVVRGPTNSIWVIDEGDFLSQSISEASTRGKVFRIEPHALTQVNRLE